MISKKVWVIFTKQNSLNFKDGMKCQNSSNFFWNISIKQHFYIRTIKTVHTLTSKLPQISFNASQKSCERRNSFSFSFFSLSLSFDLEYWCEIAANALKNVTWRILSYFFWRYRGGGKKLIKNSAFEFSFFPIADSFQCERWLLGPNGSSLDFICWWDFFFGARWEFS